MKKKTLMLILALGLSAQVTYCDNSTSENTTLNLNHNFSLSTFTPSTFTSSHLNVNTSLTPGKTESDNSD